jgi:cobalamin 5''-phosphate synthase/cobalamin synthase
MPDEEMNGQPNELETTPEDRASKHAQEDDVVAFQDEDLVGSKKKSSGAVRKMKASDFKVKAEPESEPIPETEETSPNVVQQAEVLQEPLPENIDTATHSSSAFDEEVKPPIQEVPVAPSQPVEDKKPPVQEAPTAPTQPTQTKLPVEEAPATPTQPQTKPPVQETPVAAAQPAEDKKPPVQETPAAPTQPTQTKPPVQNQRPPVRTTQVESEQERKSPVKESDSKPKEEHSTHSEKEPVQTQSKPEPWDKIGPDENGKSSGKGGIVGAMKGALSFLTIFKLNVGESEMNAFNRNFFVAPIIGALIGLIIAIMGAVFFALDLSPLMFAAFAIGGALVISKFLHFDGLVDFGDGMIVSGGKEDHIRALKDTRIGAGGLGVALVVILLSYSLLASAYMAILVALLIATTEIFVKNSMVAAAAFGTPGNGMASGQVRNTNSMTMLISTGISAVLAFALYFLMGAVVDVIDVFEFEFVEAAAVIVGAAVASLFVGWLMAWRSNKTFGFVNGDVLGATNEISRVLILLIAVILIFNL